MNDPQKRFLTEPQIALIGKELVAKGATDDQIDVYLMVLERTKLDHFTRQIMAQVRRTKNKETQEYEPTLAYLVTIDGFRVIAQRSGQYAGQQGPWWCGTDGVWREAWLDAKPPVAARVGVMRHDFKEPLYAVARFQAYAQNGQVWEKMPDLMIAKCAEALALRKAFPQELSGLYTADEMAQAGFVPEAPVEAKAAEKAETALHPAQSAPVAPVVPAAQPAATMSATTDQTPTVGNARQQAEKTTTEKNLETAYADLLKITSSDFARMLWRSEKDATTRLDWLVRALKSAEHIIAAVGGRHGPDLIADILRKNPKPQAATLALVRASNGEVDQDEPVTEIQAGARS